MERKHPETPKERYELLGSIYLCCQSKNIVCSNVEWFKFFPNRHHRKVKATVIALCLSDLQTCVLSSVELQVLTSSCFKLRTVHNIPVTSNKDGKKKEKKTLTHLSFFLKFPSLHVLILPVFLLHTFLLPLSLF